MKNKKEIVKGLYEYKKELSDEIFELKTKIYLLECSLEDIDREICKIDGHSFSEWEQRINSSWLDGDDDSNLFCYKRKCNVCGVEEITFDIDDTKVRSKKK